MQILTMQILSERMIDGCFPSISHQFVMPVSGNTHDKNADLNTGPAKIQLFLRSARDGSFLLLTLLGKQ